MQAGQTYFYELQAYDPDGDPLFVTVDGGGTDATFADDILQWVTTPTTTYGTYNFKISVSDAKVGGLTQTQNFSVDVLGSAVPNQKPVIISSPDAIGSVDTLYSANIVGVDIDGDAIRYELVAAPNGASLDAKLGTLRWTPTIDHIGSHKFTVRAYDPYGGSDFQTWQVKINAFTTPPRITSIPVVDIGVGEHYIYPITAIATSMQGASLDKIALNIANGTVNTQPMTWTVNDPIFYDLVLDSTPPYTMQISPNGILTWIPDTVGDQVVTVRARRIIGHDGMNPILEDETAALQTFTIHVHELSYDRAPIITSVPGFWAVYQGQYSYQVAAFDPNGDEIEFSLEDAQGDATIDSDGLLTWSVGELGEGEEVLIKIVASANGLETRQTYLVTIRGANQAPEIRSNPPAKLYQGQPYSYKPAAVDWDGDPITYSYWNANEEIWVPIEPSGLPVNTSSPGYFFASIQASDPFGGVALQDIGIQIVADTQAPRVAIIAPTQKVSVGSLLSVQVVATDNVQVVTRKLQASIDGTTWSNVPVSADGMALFTAPNSKGTVTFAASAADLAGNKSSNVSVTVNVFEPLPNDGKTPVITFGSDSQLITAPTSINAKIVDASDTFTWSWTLAPLDDPGNTRIIKQGNSTGTYDDSIRLDSTLYSNGWYTLTISAHDGSNGASASRLVQIDGSAKIGHLTFSVTDMTVKAAGMPITITRTYDSMRANEDGPLGPGWRLEATQARAQTDISFELVAGAGNYPPIRDGDHVMITLPDGSVRRFTFQPASTYALTIGNLSSEYRPRFIADDGAREQLIVDSTETFLKCSDGTYLSWDGLVYNPFNPTFGGGLVVRTPSGHDYTFVSDPDAPRGTAGKLVSAGDRHGNKLKYSDNGVTATSPFLYGTVIGEQAGNSVEYLWDPSHRYIIGLRDPEGDLVRYEYEPIAPGSSRKQLTAAIDRMQNKTTYSYEWAAPGYLTTVTDPLENVTLQASYDDSGRVATLMDANENVATRAYEIEVGSALESVTVGSGSNQATTSVKYDWTENTVQISGPNDAVTTTEFSSGKFVNPLIATQDNPAGDDPVTKYEYDLQGHVTATVTTTSAAINPPVSRTEIAYGPYDQPAVIVDPLNHITLNIFDPIKGDLIATRSNEGVESSFTYDIAGNVTSVTRGEAVSKFEYDPYGEVKTQQSPSGVVTSTEYVTEYYQNKYQYFQTTVTRLYDGGPVLTTSKVKRDAEDRVIEELQIRDGNTITTSTTYDPLGRVSVTTDAFGNQTKNYYDSRGLLVQTASPGHPDKLVSRTVYDELGRVDWTMDAVSTTATFDPGNSTSTFSLKAPGTHTVYDKSGRVVLTERYAEVTITLKKTANQVYLTEAGTPGALLSTTQTHYDGLGRVDWTKSSVDLTSTPRVYTKTASTFDDLGRQTQVTTSVSKVTNGVETVTLDTITQTGYDDAGRVIWTIAPSDVRNGDDVVYVKTQTEYDGDGRAIRTLVGDKTYGMDSLGVNPTFALDPTFTYAFTGSETKTKYDTLGRKENETDVMGRVTGYGYDDFGRLTSVTQPEVVDPTDNSLKAPVTKYDYDVQGNMKKITDALGRETTFTFNAYGQQTKRTLPDISADKSGGNYEEKFYNAFGDLDYTIDFNGAFNGAKVDYVYDYDKTALSSGSISLGHLVGLKDQAGTVIERYSYDKYGRRESVTIGTDPYEDVYEYEYDRKGRLTRETSLSGNDSVPLAINYGYDSNGRHTATWTGTDESASVTSIGYGYDPFGRLAAVTVHKRNGEFLDNPDTLATDESEVTRYTYTPAGHVDSVVVSTEVTSDTTPIAPPDAVVMRGSSYEYDPTHSWVTKVTHRDGDDSVLSSFEYIRAADGQINSVSESLKVDNIRYEGNSAVYVYDALNRLVEERVDTSMGKGDYTTKYTLDLVGNRLREEKTAKDDGAMADTTITTSHFNAQRPVGCVVHAGCDCGTEPRSG